MLPTCGVIELTITPTKPAHWLKDAIKSKSKKLSKIIINLLASHPLGYLNLLQICKKCFILSCFFHLMASLAENLEREAPTPIFPPKAMAAANGSLAFATSAPYLTVDSVTLDANPKI